MVRYWVKWSLVLLNCLDWKLFKRVVDVIFMVVGKFEGLLFLFKIDVINCIDWRDVGEIVKY